MNQELQLPFEQQPATLLEQAKSVLRAGAVILGLSVTTLVGLEVADSTDVAFANRLCEPGETPNPNYPVQVTYADGSIMLVDGCPDGAPVTTAKPPQTTVPPTVAPKPTTAPTPKPTPKPTTPPTPAPTPAPTEAPTVPPTPAPTEAPTTPAPTTTDRATTVANTTTTIKEVVSNPTDAPVESVPNVKTSSKEGNGSAALGVTGIAAAAGIAGWLVWHRRRQNEEQ